MSEVEELLEAGELTAAIAAAERAERAHTGDATRRISLFELLLFAGEWEHAHAQLEAAARADARNEQGARLYLDCIDALRERERLWSEGVAPHFLAAPPPGVEQHLAAIGEWRAGRPARARELLDAAEDQRPPLPGRVNDRPFADWRDAEDCLAPVLEVILSGKYMWLPFEQLRSVEVAAPKRLRDLALCPARVELRGGAVGQVFVPALYEGSSRHEDDRVRLGRLTAWQPASGDDDGAGRAVGLRLFLADEDEIAVFEARRVEFEVSGAAASLKTGLV